MPVVMMLLWGVAFLQVGRARHSRADKTIEFTETNLELMDQLEDQRNDQANSVNDDTSPPKTHLVRQTAITPNPNLLVKTANACLYLFVVGKLQRSLRCYHGALVANDDLLDPYPVDRLSLKKKQRAKQLIRDNRNKIHGILARSLTMRFFHAFEIKGRVDSHVKKRLQVFTKNNDH
jgi:hypothetical protein